MDTPGKLNEFVEGLKMEIVDVEQGLVKILAKVDPALTKDAQQHQRMGFVSIALAHAIIEGEMDVGNRDLLPILEAFRKVCGFESKHTLIHNEHGTFEA